MQNYGFTMHQLLEAGVHFGHQTRRWNPRMAPYLFGKRDGIHIVDLEQTVPLLQRALDAVRDVVAEGGRVLFVGTKRQASSLIAENANRCGQPYVNHRWLGGTLTNLRVVTSSVGKLRALGEKLESDNTGLTKRELLKIRRMHEKLERSLGGVQNMAGLPDILFVIDVNKDHIALSEATKLGIPVVAVIDSNSDPAGVTYPIPGNDDSTSAIKLYCELVSLAILSGLRYEAERRGIDVDTNDIIEERKLEDESNDEASSLGKLVSDFVEEQTQGDTTLMG